MNIFVTLQLYQKQRKTIKKLKSLALCSVLLFSVSSNINATEVETVVNIAGASNYVFRGMTQTNDKAALSLEGGVSYNGFFSGLWTSNIDFEGLDADRELDLYAGYTKDIYGFETTLTYTKFLYPNSKDVANLDEAELKVIYPIDKLSLGGKYAISTYVENDGKSYNYYEGLASYDFDIIKLNTSAGSLKNAGDNYTVGISKLFELSKGSLNLELIYSNFSTDSVSLKDEENLFAKATYSF